MINFDMILYILMELYIIKILSVQLNFLLAR